MSDFDDMHLRRREDRRATINGWPWIVLIVSWLALAGAIAWLS